ncbi:Sir2 family NAD+-dependent deacetylase [Algihabitans albus]|uniref:Sir2 family NAD+-dependent deacetylase n=1 Tax=Algihabitans albus TaxID=2164067 RepID=UPI000E5CA89B|nr:Sir2 family NAD+-dependent deacetylase [Algihabitans albus]
MTSSSVTSSSKRIVVLTGAGISKESGLDTFRDADGIWSQVSLEEVATPEGFRRDPVKVQAFYNARRRQLQDQAVKPNLAHRALGRLHRALGEEMLLVTQNIDDLHERGGAGPVLHMHGELLRARCLACRADSVWTADIDSASRCSRCSSTGQLRPHVVWFGEMPLEMERIYGALADCDLFVSIGTSGNVYPAAGFVAEAREAGAHTLELNLEPSEGATLFAEKRYGPASELVPLWVEEVLAETGVAG